MKTSARLKRRIFSSIIVVCVVSTTMGQSNKTEMSGSGFPYKLTKIDFGLLPVSMIAHYTAAGVMDNQNLYLDPDKIPSLDPHSINRFDRGATDNWDRKQNDIGDIMSKLLPVVPSAFFIPLVRHQEWRNMLTLGAMYLETYYFTTALTDFGKVLIPRVRPYMYNTSFTPGERDSLQRNHIAPEGNTSAFSGHTSRAFSAAVFISKAFTDMYGRGVASYIVSGTALSLAVYVGSSRVAAGEHFTTDVIAGALVGGAVGYLIPVLHKPKQARISLTLQPEKIAINYSF